MKQIINISLLLAGILMIIFGVSCSKMDAYRQAYAAGGEITYTGKVDSMIVYSGYYRVKFSAHLNPDPHVKYCRVYWGGRTDSITFTVTGNNIGKKIDQFITGLKEGEYSFEFVSYDSAGNHSVSSFRNGTVYGSSYLASLNNRKIISSKLNSDIQTAITLVQMDPNTGIIGSEIRYLTNSGDSADIYVPLAVTDTVMQDHKYGSAVISRSLYIPDTLSIDTFRTAYSVYQPVSGATWIDITAKYLGNPGPYFASSAMDGRWGIPGIWTVTDDVKNANGYGGLDNGSWLNPRPVLSIEAGWGLPNIPDGKIYQTITLPAGNYSITASTGDISDGSQFLTVVRGSMLPSITDMPSAALAAMPMVKFQDNTLQFTVPDDGPVSIGVQASFAGDGGSGQYLKVYSFVLKVLKS